jgi:hypothetical protein
MAYLSDRRWQEPQQMRNNMDKADIIKAIQGLLSYYVNANKPPRDDQEQKVVRFAERVLLELQGGDSQSLVGRPSKGSESQRVVMDADYYLGRGDHYDLG